MYLQLTRPTIRAGFFAVIRVHFCWMNLHHKWAEYKLLKLLGYSTILITHILQEAAVRSEIKCCCLSGTAALLLGKDLNKQQNLFSEADPNRHPLTGACDWARCTAELYEAQITHNPQIRLKSRIRVCFVPYAPHLCSRAMLQCLCFTVS